MTNRKRSQVTSQASEPAPRAGASKAEWSEPEIADLPRLVDLTLVTGGVIEGANAGRITGLV